MTAGDREQDLKEFYQSLSGRRAEPLEPDSPLYVPILQAEPGKDPILALHQSLSWAEVESVSLLTGFRGNGKSTELRRLRRLLQEDNCRVILVDMVSFLLLTKRVELSDFLLALLVAVTDQVSQESGFDVISKGLWARLNTFLNSEVELGDAKIKAGVGALGAELGLRLKTDSTYKEMLQKALRGHYAGVVNQANLFMAELVAAIRQRSGRPDQKVVLLVDSLEQIRGVGGEASLVQQSVVELFSGQAANLQLNHVHVVYTVPPYLLALSPNVGRGLSGNAIAVWPNVHVRSRDGADDADGLAVMQRIVQQRFPNWQRYFTQSQLYYLARETGGDIRDYFRLVRESLVTLSIGKKDQIDDEILTRVRGQLKSELTQIAEDDAIWLSQIHEQKDTAMKTVTDLPRLVRFLDANLIMNYLNGEPWYDLHPLIVADVERIAARARAAAGPEPGQA